MQVNSNLSKRIIKTAGVAAAGVIPAVYMTRLHMDLFKKEDKQNRAIMRNKMVGFFSGIGLSIMLAHKKLALGNFVIIKPTNNVFYQTGKIALAVLSPFAGLSLAKMINKKLYPDNFVLK